MRVCCRSSCAVFLSSSWRCHSVECRRSLAGCHSSSTPVGLAPRLGLQLRAHILVAGKRRLAAPASRREGGAA